MNQSEQINDLAKALATAQGKIQGAKQDSKNPYFKSDYADLTSVWTACKDALTSNGLAVMQTMEYNEENIILVTTLAHSSGQWIKGYLPLLISKKDSQGLGSAITYARRYALSSIVGVCAYDDDAESSLSLMEEDKKKLLKALKGEKEITEKLKQRFNVYDLTTINRADYSTVMEFMESRKKRKTKELKDGSTEVA